jgi:hypothetical protein
MNPDSIEPMEIKKLRTEDTGKIFEMAICLALKTPYLGKYSYGMDAPEKLQPRLARLQDILPVLEWTHSASGGARHDFTCSNNLHLSAKSTKKGVGKVAPQVIGQCQPSKFCGIMGIPDTPVPELKQFIQTDILRVLPVLVGYTFDCPTIYYNESLNTIRYVTLDTPIAWETHAFKWTCAWTEWKNSSTLKIIVGEKEYALLEFQFHTKSRSNMAIRWNYEHFLSIFKAHLTIVDI